MRVAECLRCRKEFEPRKAGHVFCSRECRHRGPRKEGDTVAPSEEELERLFDPKRDPERLVEATDWHPASWDLAWVELDLCDTVSPAVVGSGGWWREAGCDRGFQVGVTDGVTGATDRRPDLRRGRRARQVL